MKEKIVNAAIRIVTPAEYADQVYRGFKPYPSHLIVTAPPPARHGTLLHPMYTFGMLPKGFDDQGFITSTGRYVERVEALQIALASGQPMIDHPSRHDTLLFSEDLW